MKKKKTRFFTYGAGSIAALLILSPMVIFCFAAFISCLVLFFQGDIGVMLIMLITALCCVIEGFTFLYMVSMGLMLYCTLIEIDEKGISYGLFKKQSYRWDEVTQFGVTMLSPPERGPMSLASSLKSDTLTRSIYLVFGLPGEPPAVEWDISRFGAYEFWSRSEKPDRYLGFVDDIFAALQKKTKAKERDEVYDCFFPKRFMAMQFTTERILLINSYLKAAGFDPMAAHKGGEEHSLQEDRAE